MKSKTVFTAFELTPRLLIPTQGNYFLLLSYVFIKIFTILTGTSFKKHAPLLSKPNAVLNVRETILTSLDHVCESEL